MAQRGAVDGWDPPSVVQVTVVPGPRRGMVRAPAGGFPTRRIVTLIVVGAAACAALAAAAVAILQGGGTRSTTVVSTAAVADAMPVSARTPAYRFPLACLRITRTRETLAGALRRRTDPCWRYGVDVTAILRRVGDMWRLALEATSRTCPRIALPALVRAQLAVCRR